MALPLALQPFVLVQVAVYVVVDVGETVSVVPVAPVFQVTVPTQVLAVSVALSPKHIVFESTVTVGNGFTVTVTVPVAAQPLIWQFTVYVVVTDGVTV